MQPFILTTTDWTGCVCYLLVIRGPDTTGNLAFQVNLGGPVSLSTDRAHQDKAITIWDKSLGAIVWPREVTHLEESTNIIKESNISNKIHTLNVIKYTRSAPCWFYYQKSFVFNCEAFLFYFTCFCRSFFNFHIWNRPDSKISIFHNIVYRWQIISNNLIFLFTLLLKDKRSCVLIQFQHGQLAVLL